MKSIIRLGSHINQDAVKDLKKEIHLSIDFDPEEDSNQNVCVYKHVHDFKNGYRVASKDTWFQ